MRAAYLRQSLDRVLGIGQRRQRSRQKHQGLPQEVEECERGEDQGLKPSTRQMVDKCETLTGSKLSWVEAYVTNASTDARDCRSECFKHLADSLTHWDTECQCLICRSDVQDLSNSYHLFATVPFETCTSGHGLRCRLTLQEWNFISKHFDDFH